MSATRTHLLVPMHVDALTVTKAAPRFPFVNLAPQYRRMKLDYLTASELRKPLDRIALEKGVHLHFRLPAPMAHASSEGVFPRIPNRWLVQRFYTAASGDLNTTAWLIRGDQRSSDNAAIVLPVLPETTPQNRYDTPLEFRPTGTVNPVNASLAWSYEADTPAEIELTAVTGGDAGFSAHYPACRNILGFHDNLNGVPEWASLSYLVTGWYSSLEDDPWSQLLSRVLTQPSAKWSELSTTQRKQIDEWMSEHRCAKDFAAALPLPGALLCHGLIDGVLWDANGKNQPAHIDPFRSFQTPEEYWIDIGNSSAEAFGARAATIRSAATADLRKDMADAARDVQEDLVTALQGGLLSERYDYAGLDSELHRQGFAPATGTERWSIQSTAEDAGPGVKPRKAPPLPEGLQQQLAELNRLQQEYDRMSRRLRDSLWELYAIWYRRTLAERKPDNELREQLTPALDALKSFVPNYRLRTRVAASTRDDARQNLERALQGHGTANPGWRFTVESQPGAPFYAPRDPVLLLSGPAMQILGSESKPADAVPCRVTGEELARFTYDEENGRSGIVVDAAALPGIPNLKAIPAWSSRLFVETLLLQEMPRRKRLPSTLPNSVEPREGLVPDRVATFSWKHNPWKPVYVYWEVEWTAAANLLQPAEQWTLDTPESTDKKSQRNTDLVPRSGANVTAGSAPLRITGYSFPSTPLAAIQTAKFSGTSRDLLDTINTKLRNRISVMMSAALGGFHDALVSRRAGDQLAPLDYGRWQEDVASRYFLDPIATILGPEFHADTAPVTDSGFSPVRMGSVRILRVRVVDVFGQFLDLPLEQLAYSEAAKSAFVQSSRLAPLAIGASPAPIHLHPRICRPARLEFQGQPTAQLLPGASPDSPVCGWVVPNRLEQHLALYAANGRPAGILQRVFESNLADRLYYWVPVPGVTAQDTSSASIQDPSLREFANFVLTLDADEGVAFARLLHDSQDATEQRLPEDNSAVSDLIGRPLALVCATFRLEADGLFALDQNKSWRGPSGGTAGILKSLMTGAPNPIMDTGGLENVAWPMRLGDKRDTSDGLVGFFQGAPASGPFYVSRGFEFSDIGPEKLQSKQNLTVGWNPQTVTLLMDPQARVHATTGILPRTFFQLSSDDLALSRQIREVFFQTAPVLGPQDAPQIPKPSDDYGQWSWTYRPDVTFWKDNPDLNAASDRANLPIGWPAINEGWLRLKIDPVRIGGFWLKSPAQPPQRHSEVTLAWSVQGATQVELYRLEEKAGNTSPVLVRRWDSSEAQTEFRQVIANDMVFELRASDQAGYADKKRLEIKVTD